MRAGRISLGRFPDEKVVDVGNAADDLGVAGGDHPRDVRVGLGSAQIPQERNRQNGVADEAEAQDENLLPAGLHRAPPP